MDVYRPPKPCSDCADAEWALRAGVINEEDNSERRQQRQRGVPIGDSISVASDCQPTANMVTHLTFLHGRDKLDSS